MGDRPAAAPEPLDARRGHLRRRRHPHLLNGRLAGTRAQSGPLRTSSHPLRFGGNAVWREWFAGLIDEVRVYDRALDADRIRADMRRPVRGPTRGDGRTPGKGAKVRYRGRSGHR